MRGVLLAVVIASCADPHDVVCGDQICPSNLVCAADDTCVLPEQVTACDSAADDMECTYDNVTGFCHGSVCRPARCGDGIVDPGEVCDDGNTVPFDGCNSDCSSRFEKMETPTGANLDAVWALDDTLAYAVGDRGTVIIFTNGAWSAPLDLGGLGLENFDLTAVWFSGPSDVYLGLRGLDGFLADEYFHFDGTKWKPHVTSQGDVTGIWGSGAGDVYVTSTGGISHDDGSKVTKSQLPDIPDGVECGAPNCCAVGGAPVKPTGVFGTSSTDVYILGATAFTKIDQATFVAQRYLFHGNATNGFTCVAQVDPDVEPQNGPSTLTAIAADAQDFYVANQQNVAAQTLPPGYCSDCAVGTFRGLAITSASELLGAGPSGTVMSFDRTTGAWTHLITPTELDLQAITATSPTNVFIAANSGIILH